MDCVSLRLRFLYNFHLMFQNREVHVCIPVSAVVLGQKCLEYNLFVQQFYSVLAFCKLQIRNIPITHRIKVIH